MSISEVLRRDGFDVACIAASSFLYLLVDLYIVIRRFASILKTGSFWLFWFCVSVLNFLAFKALSGAQDSAKKPFGDAQEIALIVMSTLGTVAILQSFALKIGDRRVVDVGKLLDDFRATVLQDIARQQAITIQKITRHAANRLYELFKDNPGELHEAFVNVMSFGGRDSNQLHRDLAQIAEDANVLQVRETMFLAQRIAQADVREAWRLARRSAWDADLSKDKS